MSFVSNLQGVGHQLMALRIDQQFLEVVKAQLVQAVEAFGGSLAEHVRAEAEAIVELLYYILRLATRWGRRRSGSSHLTNLSLSLGSTPFNANLSPS
jgi:hypothetical protein